MFQLVCDPSGVVVETTMKELVPALINWGNKLDHILRVLFSYILSSAQVSAFLCNIFTPVNQECHVKYFADHILYFQNCPPLSGVEGSVESHLHVLGERERWNIDVLLRLLSELLKFAHQKAVETCPFPSVSDSEGTLFSISLLELYAG